MPANDDLRQRVVRFKERCKAICAEAREMVLANRAIMRKPEHEKQSRLAEKNANCVSARAVNVADAFANRTDDLLQIIQTDLDLALTFTDISQQTMDPGRKHLLARNAFLAFENALRIRAKIAVPPERKRGLDAKLRELQSRLAEVAKNSRMNLKHVPVKIIGSAARSLTSENARLTP